LDEAGKEYDLPRFLSSFEEVGTLLQREAGVTHEELQDRFPRYERDQEVRITLNLKVEDAIRKLGFNPKRN